MKYFLIKLDCFYGVEVDVVFLLLMQCSGDCVDCFAGFDGESFQ